MSKSDATPLHRQWLLLQALGARRIGLTIREMADETGVTSRTIRRDLVTLQRVGFPLVERETEHGRKHWRLGAEASSMPLAFSWDEAIALYLARKHLDVLAGTHLWESAQKAFQKVRSCLGDAALRYLEKMSAAFHQTTVGAGDYARKAEIIDQLMIGIEDGRITFITYHSMRATEPVTYDVYPYGIVFHRQSLYLIAYSVTHEEVRHFKIDRIHDAEPQELRFVRPKDFDLERHLAGSFGIYRGNGKPTTVRIRFAAEVARYVEESRWHHSQQFHDEPDGSVSLTMQLSDTTELMRWVMSFGSRAVVIEPQSLRETIAAELVAAFTQYGDAPRKKRDRQSIGDRG